MIRRIVAAAAVGLMMSGGAVAALDLDAMSDAEKDAFGAAVREYLLENPEVLMEAIEILEARQAEEAAAADDLLVSQHSDAIFDDGHSFVGGNPEGDITIVEFLDYRCSFCRRAHPEVAELVATDGNIRTITKEFPILGDESVEASRFAIAVLQEEGPEAYKRVSDLLMNHRGAFSRAALGRLAADEGLSADEIVKRMDSDAVTDVIRANRQLGQLLSVTGTPTFVFGDQMVRGYVPLEGMRAVVAELRGE